MEKYHEWTDIQRLELSKDFPVMSRQDLLSKYGYSNWKPLALYASRLGLKRAKRITEEQKIEIRNKFENGVAKELLKKEYNLSDLMFYKIAERKITRTNGPQWSDEKIEEFKLDYPLMPEKDLEIKYSAPYCNLQSRANRYGAVRDKLLIIHGKKSKLDENAKKLYLEDKLSSAEIAKIYGLKSSHVVRDYLKKNGVEIRSLSDAFRIYEVDQYYFDEINTHAKAYFLGYLAADGYNYQNTGGSAAVVLSIGEIDREILEYFLNELKSNIPIKIGDRSHLPNSQNIVSISIHGKHMSNVLANKYGIVQCKSLVLKYPYGKIPDVFLNSFVRGFCDGNGFIYTRNSKTVKKTAISFSGSKEFLVGLRNEIERVTGIFTNITMYCSQKSGVNNWDLAYGDCLSVTNLANWMYGSGLPYLSRKYIKYQELLNINKYRIPRSVEKKEENNLRFTKYAVD